MKYRVRYSYLAQGVEGHANEVDYGLFEANSEQEAIEKAIMKKYPTDIMYGPNNAYSSRDFVRNCLSAKIEN